MYEYVPAGQVECPIEGSWDCFGGTLEALNEKARQEEVHPDALGSTLQNLGLTSQQKGLFDIPATSGAESTSSSSLPSDFTPLFFTKAQ